jgi:hypothetical protein
MTNEKDVWSVAVDLDPFQPTRVISNQEPLDFVTVKAVSGDRESLEWFLEYVRDRTVCHGDVTLNEIDD